MVSRNYNVQADRSVTLNAKSPNNATSYKNAQNNLSKIKQNIHYKQSVGTQYCSPKEFHTPTKIQPKKQYEKPQTIAVYTPTINQDLSPNLDSKCISESVSTFTYHSPNKECIYSESSNKQRNTADPIYQQYNPNISTFSNTFKIRPTTPNNSLVQNNSLPTIAENIVEEGEYPVDVGNLNFDYTGKNAKCLANSAIKCSTREMNQQDGCFRSSRFQYSPDHQVELTDTLKGFHKYKYQGSHPDSLYRVPTMGNGVGGGPWTHGAKRLRSSCRLLKWPLALTALCIGLALLVYFLMPDINPPLLVSDKVNSTEWQQDESNAFENIKNKSSEDDKRILQFDFVDDGTNNENVLNKFVELLKKVEPVEEENAKPLPPIFPVNISPSVQYGNENQDSNEERTPKKPLLLHPSTDSYDDRFLTQTFAIFYNKDASLDTTPSNSADSKEQKTDENQPSFTSGHQNSFGIPIEETERLKTTTQSAIYNTKVSPTLPSMVDKNRIRSTTVRSRWNTTEDGICHSTRLSMCRGVLPYDLTTLPLVTGITTFQELDAAVPYFDYILKSGCSPRARQFVCSLLEPECKPKGMKILPPCRRACKAIAESCQDIISASPELSQVFNCQQYPEHSSECVTLARGAHCLSGELRCPVDGSCVPSHWRCDNISDCPGGTDELNCDDQSCAPSEFRCGDRNSCIPEEWVCDGHQDCIGAEDEASCGTVGESDVISAASYHPRPALMLRPKLRLQPQSTVSEPSVITKAPQEYDNSKELLMMSDSVMPVIKPISSLTARKMPDSTTPKTYQVISSSTSVSSSTSNCPKYDPNCRRNKVTIIQSLECIKGVNCTSDEKKEISTTEKIVSTTKNDESESVSSATSHSSPCPQGELRCVDGRCITLAQLCDHQRDCSDGADEANCFT